MTKNSTLAASQAQEKLQSENMESLWNFIHHKTLFPDWLQGSRACTSHTGGHVPFLQARVSCCFLTSRQQRKHPSFHQLYFHPRWRADPPFFFFLVSQCLWSTAFHQCWWEAACPGTARCHFARDLQQKPGWKLAVHTGLFSTRAVEQELPSLPALASFVLRHGPNTWFGKPRKLWGQKRAFAFEQHLGVPHWVSNYLHVMSLVKYFATRTVVCIKTHNKTVFPKYWCEFPIPQNPN